MNSLAIFADFFKNGGPFMYVILLTAVTIIALAAERFWVIGRAASFNSGKLTRDLVQRVAKGDVSGAMDLSRRFKGPVGKVAHAILTRNDTDEERLQSAAEGRDQRTLSRRRL